MNVWKRILAGAVSAALLGSLAIVPASAEETFTLGIYSTSELSGKCSDRDPLTGQEQENTYLQVASAMRTERAAQNGTILIDTGDAITGSAVTAANLLEERGRNHPVALCLRAIGYDAFVPGERELALPGSVQQRFYDLLQTPAAPGTPVQPICANLRRADTQELTMKPYQIKTFLIGDRTFRVGILGFTATEVSRACPEEYRENLAFVQEGNLLGSYAYEWANGWQQKLREEEKCDFVVAALHGQTGTTQNTADPAAFHPEAQALHFVQNTVGIDLVLTGHQPESGVTVCSNAAGQPVSIASAGGSTLTRTLVTIRENGAFTVGVSETLDLNSYADSPELRAQMEPYYTAASAYANQEIGLLSGGWNAETGLYYESSDTMNLLHEAQIWASGADLSFLAPACNENLLFAQAQNEDGKLRRSDVAHLYPDTGEILYLVEMTGAQIRSLLEACTDDYWISPDGKIAGGDADTAQLYGIYYNVYLGNPKGIRVANLTFQGEPVSPYQTFRVAVSSRLLTANEGSRWKKATGIDLDSASILWNSAQDSRFYACGGSLTWVFFQYIENQTAGGKSITPPEARSSWNIYPAASEEVLAPVTRLEFVKALYEAAGSPETPWDGNLVFSDLKSVDPAVAWAVQMGMVTGNGDGRFLPDTPVSREQAAIMLLRYDKWLGRGPMGAWAVPLPYKDAVDGSVWAADALMWNVIQGYLPADAAGNFRPQADLTWADLDYLLKVRS